MKHDIKTLKAVFIPGGLTRTNKNMRIKSNLSNLGVEEIKKGGAKMNSKKEWVSPNLTVIGNIETLTLQLEPCPPGGEQNGKGCGTADNVNFGERVTS